VQEPSSSAPYHSKSIPSATQPAPVPPCRPTALLAARIAAATKVGKIPDHDGDEIIQRIKNGPMDASADNKSVGDRDDCADEDVKKYVLAEDTFLLGRDARHGSSRRPPHRLVSIVGRQHHVLTPHPRIVIVPAANSGLDASRDTVVRRPEGCHGNFRSRRRVHLSRSY
jgi:hypothetical protein